MESRSIYREFYLKLIFATSLFIVTLSYIFFEYSRASFYDNLQNNLLFQAKQIEKGYISFDKFQNVVSHSQIIELFANKKIDDFKFSKFVNKNKTRNCKCKKVFKYY